MLSVGSLCAGIGGFDLAAERAGLSITWQVEVDAFCREVLAKHWPAIDRYMDIKDVHGSETCYSETACQSCLLPVDVICAGFPCQPVCHHGRRRGAGDTRWLWPEIHRLIGELEPGYVVLENVVGLLSPGRGFSRILADLASLGFDAEWECLPAHAVGLPHARDRVWIVAYRPDHRRQTEPTSWLYREGPPRHHADRCGPYPPRRNAGSSEWRAFTDAHGPEPGIRREADGFSCGLDRLYALGNSIVPPIAEWIFRSIVQAEASLVMP